MLFLDNLSSLVRSGKENETESWHPFQDWLLQLRRQGLAVAFVHHSGKNGLQRGTSGREDILDTVIHLRSPKDYDPKQGCRFECHYEKARSFYGEDAMPFEAQLIMGVDLSVTWRVRGVEVAEIERVAVLLNEGCNQRTVAQMLGLSVGKINRLSREAGRQGLLKQPLKM